jgi:AcrR family transcriptional regulator
VTQGRRRPGRPPSSESTDTRQRIVDAAMRCFARTGFEMTTNRAVAAEAGISTGPLYHYFDSKVDLYAAVCHSVYTTIYERFEEVAAERDRFIDRFVAVLDSAHELNRIDPNLAIFSASASIDMRRHPDLAAQVGKVDRFAPGEFFARLIDDGVASGEIAPGDRLMVEALVRVITVGLTDALSHDSELQRDAIDGLASCLRGDLVGRPVTPAGSPA